MDTAILKRFAIQSRQELMQKINNKIDTFYINESFIEEKKGELHILTNEKHLLSLTSEEVKKRELLIKRIKELSLEQVIEEVAYTWFNRIIAIRYMEINDILPLTKENESLGIRVLSSKDNSKIPEILKLTNLMHPDLDINFESVKYTQLKYDNEKFKYVLLLVCKKIAKVIPQVFGGITDYIDILIPDNLLNDTGFVTKVINEIPEDNFSQVEIIGWLYQYYISEKKDEVFKNLKKNIKISKNNVPAATQLFTPDWVVKYMVENSLGRILKDSVKADLSSEMKFYKDNSLRLDDEEITQIKFLDPCCGSGHILVYAFELFAKAYEKLGYNKDIIAKLILENNIFGIDVDDRAGQLSILSLVLKARKYDKNIFKYKIAPNIVSIQESNVMVSSDMLQLTQSNKEKYEKLVNIFFNAKEYGSLLKVPNADFSDLLEELEEKNSILNYEALKRTKMMVKQWNILSNKYNVVVTNPPYMGNKGMSNLLSNYVKKYFNTSKSDMFAIFIEQVRYFSKENGIYAMITQPSILFLKSFEDLRNKIINEQTILSLLHMGRGIFGIDFGSVAFVIANSSNSDFEGDYYRLHKRTFQYINVDDISNIYLNALNDEEYKFDFDSYNIEMNNVQKLEKIDDEELKIYYRINQSNFLKIPGTPIAYWIDKSLLNIFKNEPIEKSVLFRQGMATSDNNRFLRYWYEVSQDKMCYECNDLSSALKSKKKWFMYNKGGAYRKWYGNHEYVVNWENDGKEMKEYTAKLPQGMNVRLKSREYYFKECYSWSKVCASNISFRYYPDGFAFDVAGCCAFMTTDDSTLNVTENAEEANNLYYLLGLSNSVIASAVLTLISPTLNFELDHVKKIPLIVDENKEKEIEGIVKENIEISKQDWDSFENSWNFKTHPLVKKNYSTIKEAFEFWKLECETRFKSLKENEEKLNSIFIDIYGLNGILKPNVSEDKIVIRLADRQRDIKSLISYAVGCMFGRYSLDDDGLVFAGGEFDLDKYKTFNVVPNNIIQITNELYFEDDIVCKFKQFLKIVYGEISLNENLDFIAESLGKKDTETSEDTIRRYFVNDFFSDHVNIYQNCPIYWLFDSGKKNGFKALVYMHRYNDGLVSKVRLDYLHKIQIIYEKMIKEIEYRLTSCLSISDKKEVERRYNKLNAKLQEINEYDEMIAYIADIKPDIVLDDGVRANYEKFNNILAKIKGN